MLRRPIHFTPYLTMQPHYVVKHRCYITLQFIAIRLRVQYPSDERPPYTEEGTEAQVPKEDQCPRTNSI